MHTDPTRGLLAQFEADCAAAGIDPKDVLTHAGLHRSLWKKWKETPKGPTLHSFEAATRALAEMKEFHAMAKDAVDADV
jgi:hypothetical protein